MSESVKEHLLIAAFVAGAITVGPWVLFLLYRYLFWSFDRMAELWVMIH